jgi:8-oxo-dGTP pyrophosphatase MutT (NUDIX family)
MKRRHSSHRAPRPWRRHARRTLIDSAWIRHHIDRLELPSGKHIDFHALEFPMKVAGVLPIGDDGRILLTYQYRYMADACGWELPAGNVPEDEDLVEGAHRELLEETGHSAKSLELIYEYYPQIGRSDHYFNVFVARGVWKVTDQLDDDEVTEIRWFELDEILDMIRTNELMDGFTTLAVLVYALKKG